MRQPLLLLALLTAVLVLAPGAALADDCHDVCTSSTPCDTECGWDPGKGGPVTCAEYGLCDEGGGGSCSPNYQVVGSSVLGGFQVNNYFPISCDYVQVIEYTWSDANSCPSSSNYTTCDYSTVASRSDHSCCNFFSCSGQTSC